jgi:hypothetical protein
MQYVLQYQWFISQCDELKKPRSGTPCSSIPTSDQTKKLYQSLRFMNKKS